MEPLQHALGQLRGSNFGGRDRRSGLCSSEEELNDVVSFNFNVFECSLYLLFLILEFIPFFFFMLLIISFFVLGKELLVRRGLDF